MRSACGCQSFTVFTPPVELFLQALAKLTNFGPPLYEFGIFLFFSYVSARADNTLSCCQVYSPSFSTTVKRKKIAKFVKHLF
jgi:hypothetical protein